MSRNRVAGLLGAVAALIGASPVGAQTAFTDQVTCQREGEAVFQLLSQLRITGCGLRSECQITGIDGASVPGAAAVDSLSVKLIHEVDLTQSVDVAVKSAECGNSTQRLTITPARLMLRRVPTIVDGIRLDRNDVPVFDADSTQVTLLLSPAKAREIRAAIEAALDRCRQRNR